MPIGFYRVPAEEGRWTSSPILGKLASHPTATGHVENWCELSNELTNLLVKKFISRPDAKAQQSNDGKWFVHTTTRKADGPRIPWRREDLNAHLAGEATFGHYLLSIDSTCKLFAFDIDLEKSGSLPAVPISGDSVETPWDETFYDEPDLRGAWLNRAHPGREFMKLQFKQMAHKLCKAIQEELSLPCAVAYSGGKGVHVYAFTGPIPANEAREGAQIVLDSIGEFKPLRGDNFFKHADTDVLNGFPNLSIEVFPKQDSLDGKDLGNLMRLPLGRNLKAPKEPAFFLDMTAPIGVFKPLDPTVALNADSPWA